MGTADKINELLQERDRLAAERRERARSIPAHSIRPHQLLVIEELDERIAQIEAQIDVLGESGS